MGAYISTLHRLRRRFLINIYNDGVKDEILSIKDLFPNDEVSPEDLCKVIDISSAFPVLDEICRIYFQGDRIPVKVLEDFIQQGRIPPLQKISQCIDNSFLDRQHSKHSLKQDEASYDGALVLHENYKKMLDEQNTNIEIPDRQSPKPKIWKKHEIIITEKIVKHTVVHTDGVQTVVVESDKTQNELIHIENDEGEYAHRELTQQEQLEEVNEKIVDFVRATEEYVHLKSKFDEYEYTHSDIPNGKDASYDGYDDSSCSYDDGEQAFDE